MIEFAKEKIAEEMKKRDRRYKIKAFSDFDEMLKSDVSAIFIATDADKHMPSY